MQLLYQHPVTCAILCLYVGNVVWYLAHGRAGLALYWMAAATITVSATWLTNWTL